LTFISRLNLVAINSAIQGISVPKFNGLSRQFRNILKTKTMILYVIQRALNPFKWGTIKIGDELKITSSSPITKADIINEVGNPNLSEADFELEETGLMMFGKIQYRITVK
jgi:hypothetical protein